MRRSTSPPAKTSGVKAMRWMPAGSSLSTSLIERQQARQPLAGSEGAARMEAQRDVGRQRFDVDAAHVSRGSDRPACR